MFKPQVVRPSTPFVPFSDLMSKVGYFLFYWSRLEQALTQALREPSGIAAHASGRVCGTFKERLERWCELAPRLPGNENETETIEQIANQALNIRTIRNSIVHGLLGGSSMPDTEPGYIECAVGGYDQPTGEVTRYSIDDLEHLTQSTDACLRGFRNVHDFNYCLNSRFERGV